MPCLGLIGMNVNIIICTYNRAEKLKGAIESLLVSEVPENTSVRLIIVDNNSTDDTRDVVKEIKGTRDVSVRYVFEGMQGKSHALNAALRQLEGDIVAFGDDDQTVEPRYLQELAAAVKRYPEINCFGGRIVAVYPEKCPDWLDIDGDMKFLRSVFGDKDEGKEDRILDSHSQSQTPGGGNMFFRRHILEANGFFRTDLGPVGKELGFSEDTEYCRRLLQKGERFMYIPSVVVYHPVHEDRLAKEYLLNWQYKCGRSEVRRCGGYNDPRKILGVPRYLYRKLGGHAVGWSLSLGVKERFYHRLRLYYTIGEVLEHLKIRSITR